MNNDLKHRMLIFLAVFLFFTGALVFGNCSKSAASAPGVWVCLAAPPPGSVDYNKCYAISRSRNKSNAKFNAEVKCNEKCLEASCRIEGCVRRR